MNRLRWTISIVIGVICGSITFFLLGPLFSDITVIAVDSILVMIIVTSITKWLLK